MSLPIPNLDDRTFDDIVADALRLIPRTCPEWTDHGVGDPGRTLIELFAWMTEMVIYRTNQVPDKMHRHFLDMLGMGLRPPSPAKVMLRFDLSAAQDQPVVVPAGVEVATARSEANKPIVFTTDAELVIRPARLVGVFTANAGGSPRARSLAALRSGDELELFSAPPSASDAFGVVLSDDMSGHRVAIHLKCRAASGANVNPSDPPWIWEAWCGDERGWVVLPGLVEDETRAFNQDGVIRLALPAGCSVSRWDGLEGTALRCRHHPRPDGARWATSPVIADIAVGAIGASVTATHGVTIEDEILGRSDGSPGQRFKLQRSPVIRCGTLLVELPEGRAQPGKGALERWVGRRDFSRSGPDDRHFVLDPMDGTLRLGPSLLQPDGSMRDLGRVPPKGARLRVERYRVGGGLHGNVPAGALTVLRTAVPYIAAVSNHEPAHGGLDAQQLQDALTRAPHFVRARTRAVLASDYEFHALAVPGVGRARCLAPGEVGAAGLPPAGTVRVVLLPTDPGLELQSKDLQISAALVEKVKRRLDRRRPAGVRLLVEPAQVQWLSLSVQVVVESGTSVGRREAIREEVEQALRRTLSPWVGGGEGRGWPFGRAISVGELTAVVQRQRGVLYVDALSLASLPQPNAKGSPVTGRLALAPDAVPALHEVRIAVVDS